MLRDERIEVRELIHKLYKIANNTLDFHRAWKYMTIADSLEKLLEEELALPSEVHCKGFIKK